MWCSYIDQIGTWVQPTQSFSSDFSFPSISPLLPILWEPSVILWSISWRLWAKIFERSEYGLEVAQDIVLKRYSFVANINYNFVSTILKNLLVLPVLHFLMFNHMKQVDFPSNWVLLMIVGTHYLKAILGILTCARKWFSCKSWVHLQNVICYKIAYLIK